MTVFETLSVVTAVLTLCGFLVSRAFLRNQTRSVVATSKLASWEAFQRTFSQVNQVFITHPGLRDVFYEDEADGPVPTPVGDDLRRARSVAEDLLDLFDLSLRSRDTQTAAERIPLEWFDDFVDDSFRLSDLMCEHCILRRDWYDERLVAVALRYRRRRPAPEGA